MRILLWHGYLLTGTGSNIHTANLARVWREQGHEVLLLCQERSAHLLPWVDATGTFDPSNSTYGVVATDADPAAGRVDVVLPDIGGLLPVYVYDDYEGFRVKRFVELDDDELRRYTDANVAALVTATRRFAPDVVIVGHEIMGPYIAFRARERTGRPYVVKLHGSALEYAVKKQQRYLRYADIGLNGAAAVFGGSRYMVDAAAGVVPGWRDRSEVVNPGCDAGLFRPRPRPGGRRPTVAYVGKLIAAKGVHHLIAALGLIPHDLEVVIVGFGGFEEGLRELHEALRAGDLVRAREVADRGEDGPLEHLRDFLHSDAVDDAYLARISEIPLTFAGRLDHGRLSAVLPSFDVLVAPSVVPEAFGMVVAEAAAAGVLPIAPAHSGIGEAAGSLEGSLAAQGLLRFDPHDPVRGIAAAVARLLRLSNEERDRVGLAAADHARREWSWDHVAWRALDLAAQAMIQSAGMPPGGGSAL